MLDLNVAVRRRGFLRFNLAALATGVLATVFNSGLAHAVRQSSPPGIPSLNPEDPQAKALSYTPDVTDESQKAPTSGIAAGQRCGNCQLFSGTPGAEWGPCAIFSYRVDPDTKKNLVVSSDGWCKGWAPRAG